MHVAIFLKAPNLSKTVYLLLQSLSLRRHMQSCASTESGSHIHFSSSGNRGQFVSVKMKLQSLGTMQAHVCVYAFERVCVCVDLCT